MFIKKLNDKVNELERTSPNMGANQTLNREQTETPSILLTSKV